jgi:RNA polymerase sigma factor (TIGR02999 family)
VAETSAELDEIFPQLYDELRRIAARALRGERSNHTLQPTALVHEAYLKMRHIPGFAGKNRSDVLALAATAMRRVLVDHARARLRKKRGGTSVTVALSEADSPRAPPAFDLLALDQALTRLTEIDGQQVRIIELRYLAGMTVEEAAQVMGVSTTTVKRETMMARAWLFRELKGDTPRNGA